MHVYSITEFDDHVNNPESLASPVTMTNTLSCISSPRVLYIYMIQVQSNSREIVFI